MTASTSRFLLSLSLVALSATASAQSMCAVPTAATVFIAYQGTTPQCNQLNGVCVTGETVEFSIRTLPPVTPECASVVVWNIAGHPPVIGTTIQLTFTSAGTYPVVATVQNAQFTFNATVPPVNVISAPPSIPTLSVGVLLALVTALAVVAVVELKP